MGDKSLGVDNKPHELKLGASFDNRSKVAFHSIRYDFKPASVDTSKDSLVEVGEGNKVTVAVPHVEGSGTTHTVYQGNKRPLPKECVLIIDHEKGTFTLEKLSNVLQLKKTRLDASRRILQNSRPLTPVDCNKLKLSPSKMRASQKSPPSHQESPSITPVHTETAKDPSPIGVISDSSSDSSSGSDSSGSDSEDEDKNKAQKPVPVSSNAVSNVPSAARNNITTSSVSDTRPKFITTLSEDLRLSDSGSDSD